jgi:hypothetical protein
MGNVMANKLNNRQVATIQTNLRRHFDEFDLEAMRQADAINRARSLAPAKIGKRKSTFSRSAYHPNRV